MSYQPSQPGFGIQQAQAALKQLQSQLSTAVTALSSAAQHVAGLERELENLRAHAQRQQSETMGR